MIIVGNKSDLEKQLQSKYEGEIPFIITSAKSGHNIEKMFSSLTERVLNKIKEGFIEPDGSYGVKKGKSLAKSNRLSFMKESDFKH